MINTTLCPTKPFFWYGTLNHTLGDKDLNTATAAPHALMNQKEAASFLGLSHRTLENWRLKGGGPAFVRMSHRCVRYRLEALLAWLDKRETTSTSAPLVTA